MTIIIYQNIIHVLHVKKNPISHGINQISLLPGFITIFDLGKDKILNFWASEISHLQRDLSHKKCVRIK